MKTVFYSNRTMDRAILNPTDTVKPVENFPEVCISTFSKRIIDRVSTQSNAEVITNLITKKLRMEERSLHSTFH